jgi:endonuclease YncB( thermonuclease family)
VTAIVTTSPELGRFRARLTREHDGDSFWVLADTWFGSRYEPELRLYGVHAPELGQPGGSEALAFVNAWLTTANSSSRKWPLWIETVMTKTFEPDQRRTFTRYLATVWPFDRRTPAESLNLQLNQFLADHPEWPPGA